MRFGRSQRTIQSLSNRFHRASTPLKMQTLISTISFLLTIRLVASLNPGRTLHQEMDSSGAITYSIHERMPFTGVWNVYGSPKGPRIVSHDGFARIEVNAMQTSANWLFVSVQPSLPTNGSETEFKVRFNVVQNAEVRFTILSVLTLRITDPGETSRWATWRIRGFDQLSPSRIQADGNWYHIKTQLMDGTLKLYEEGEESFSHPGVPVPQLSQTFHVQLIGDGASLSMDIADLKSLPVPV